MDKYEHFNTAPSPEYDMYTEDYIRTLFTLFNPVQSYRYPTTSLSSSYVPTYKTQATQSEVSLQARENAVRYLLNFHQIEVLRCLPWHRRSARTGTSTQKRRLNLRTPDYWELNRRRPSVIRRSIKGGAKCSSPREAVLEPNFETHHEMKTYQEITPVTPNYPQSNRSFIRKDPHLSTNNSHSRVQNYPQFEASVIPEDPHIIHKVPQRECQKSRVIQTTVPFTPRESQHDHVIQPTITKRPFVSTGPHSAEDKKSPAHNYIHLHAVTVEQGAYKRPAVERQFRSSDVRELESRTTIFCCFLHVTPSTLLTDVRCWPQWSVHC